MPSILASANTTVPSGYAMWMSELKQKGYAVFFLTVMFDFNRNPEPTKRTMRIAIEECYSRLATSLSRHPEKLSSIVDMPLLAAFAEAPSIKQQALGTSKLWGTHYHGFLALPPSDQTRLSHDYALAEFQKYAKRRVPIIQRIHLEAARNLEKIASYSLKGRRNWNADFLGQFDVLLPRTREEMSFVDVNRRKSRMTRSNLIKTKGASKTLEFPSSKTRLEVMSTSKLLTREEVASAIQVSLVKLDRMRLDGLAPPEIKIGRSIRFSEEDFETWLARQSSQRRVKPTTTRAEPSSKARKSVAGKKDSTRVGTFGTGNKGAIYYKLR